MAETKVISLQDVQARPDERRLAIDEVGVREIRYPITVRDRDKGEQNTIATVSMYVELPHTFKGTHMSRFIEILGDYRGRVGLKMLSGVLDDLCTRLDAPAARFELVFPYFIERSAPVSGAKSLSEYTVRIRAARGEDGDRFEAGATVPVTTLCPCSKEISDHGAHNQRAEVTVMVNYRRFFWIEDLIDLVESCGSCETYALLKRPDEKYVTEKAYANPKFVEDVVRDVAARLRDDENFRAWEVSARGLESIHNHDVYARIVRRREDG